MQPGPQPARPGEDRPDEAGAQGDLLRVRQRYRHRGQDEPAGQGPGVHRVRQRRVGEARDRGGQRLRALREADGPGLRQDEERCDGAEGGWSGRAGGAQAETAG